MTSTVAPIAPAPSTTTRVLAAANAVALLAVGGLFSLVALLPLAMAADSCGTSPAGDPLMCTALPQLAALGLLVAGLLGGVVVAVLASRRSGWPAVRFGAAGWGLWVLGVVAAGGVLWLGAVVPSPF